MSAGALDRRAEFERRTEVADGYGNTVSAWSSVFTRWCAVTFLRGTESVMAARLEGRQPVVLRVRKDPETDTITEDMRCVIEGRAYNIREMPRPTGNRLYLEFLAESGVADG